jgi:hypothetical protein
MGTALLGLREGTRMEWRTLDGRRKSISVLEVQYQPESRGLDLDSAAVVAGLSRRQRPPTQGGRRRSIASSSRLIGERTTIERK